MLVRLAKVAIMFGLRSSGGSYEKMRSEYYLDTENPFCPQVGASDVIERTISDMLLLSCVSLN